MQKEILKQNMILWMIIKQIKLIKNRLIYFNQMISPNKIDKISRNTLNTQVSRTFWTQVLVLFLGLLGFWPWGFWVKFRRVLKIRKILTCLEQVLVKGRSFVFFIFFVFSLLLPILFRLFDYKFFLTVCAKPAFIFYHWRLASYMNTFLSTNIAVI